MLAYQLFGTNDLPRAIAYYEKLLAPLGAKRVWEGERGVAWGSGEHSPGFGVCKPFDGRPATWGNGTMAALAIPERAMVDQLHALAMSLGSLDEGAPGERGPGFYAAYVRDLDGNKLAFVHMG